MSDRPYREALEIGDQQEAIMKEIMQLPDVEARWDSPEVSDRMLELLKQNGE